MNLDGRSPDSLAYDQRGDRERRIVPKNLLGLIIAQYEELPPPPASQPEVFLAVISLVLTEVIFHIDCSACALKSLFASI